MTLLTVSLTLLVGIALLTALNIGMQVHLKREARAAVASILESNTPLARAYTGAMTDVSLNQPQTVYGLESEMPATTGESSEVAMPMDMPVVVNETQGSSLFMVRELFDIDNEAIRSIYTSHEKELFDYYISNKATMDKNRIQEMRIGEMTVYFAVMDTEGGGRSVTSILYVDSYPVFTIMKSLKVLFLGVMVVLILGATLIGIQTGKRLEDSEQKLKRFFSNASHELKTPLMSIQGYAEGLQSGVITDTRMASTVILQQSDRMQSLVEELLLLSKIESGQVQLDLQKINVSEVMDSVVAAHAVLTEKKQLSVECEFPDAPIWVKGDERQLDKAFSSIFSNAAKYAQSRIQVRVSVDGKRVQVRIADDGAGISEQDLEHVFKRFYTGTNGNTGVGLSLAHEIMQLHRGAIRVENNQGAQFIVSLPRSKS
ncbi:HAMP domain-containing sensor histidine kinase [Paenibacillus sp. y28]